MSINDETPEEEEQPQISAEEYLALQKSSIRKKSWWGIGIGGVIVIFWFAIYFLAYNFRAAGFFAEPPDLSWRFFTGNILFVIGLLGLAAGIFGLRYAKTLTLEDIIPTREAVEFLQQGQGTVQYYSYFLVAAIVLVTFAQYATDLDASIGKAGFVKPDFLEKGQYWRILTGAAMHAGFLHIYFNGQALYGFGGLIELISNRAHLAVVFLLAVLGGGLLSVVGSPAGTMVGASGGIMGLVGYLAVYGYRRKQQLPPDFLKSILINVAFVAGIGLVGYQFIDNFAHFGGLIAGAAYGFLQIPRDIKKNPREAGQIATVAGMISLVIFGAGALLAILRITGD